MKRPDLSLFSFTLSSLSFSLKVNTHKRNIQKVKSISHNQRTITKKKLHFNFLLTSIILVTTQCFLFCFRKIKRNTKNESRKDPSVCLPLLIWVSLRLPLPPPQVLPLALLLPLAPPPVLHLLPPLLLWPIRFPPSKHS